MIPTPKIKVSISSRAAAFAAVVLMLFTQSALALEPAKNPQATPVPNQLGLHTNDYAFRWEAPEQITFRLLVASDERKLAADVGDLWDSGRRYGTRNAAGELYSGNGIPDGATVWWKVKVWGAENTDGGWSTPANFTVPAVAAVAGAPAPARNRIVFVGGTTIYDMGKYGYFESAITSHWPQHDIIFRNVGWPGDDVFGTARSEFEGAQHSSLWKATGPKADFGFSELVKHVHETGPTTLFVGYGAETAFLEKEEQWVDWQAGYRRLLDELAKTSAQMILLTPVRQEKHGAALLDVTENNKRLESTSKFILDIAKERGCRAVDNFRRTFGERRDGSDVNSDYSDGIHLNESGHQTLVGFMAEDLGLPLTGYSLYYAEGKDGDPSRMTISGGVATEQITTKRGFRLDAELDRLPTIRAGGIVRSPWPAEANAEAPSFRVRIDGNAEVGYFDSGRFAITSGPDQTQAEELRKKINEKNQLHRYKLRPINKTYIFLHRRHEMGHLAYELEDFDRLVAGHERAIAHLRKPRPHTYEIERVEPWKSPRNYPDHEVPKDIPKPDVVAELAAFTVAEGFEVNLFAANPMIANPINMNWDSRGRAWVTTSTTYPHIKPGRTPNDRIVILEDTDHDGRADKHTVFADGLLVPHSVMPVPGGAYVCSGTEFLFLADADGDDVSESRRAVYSGFGNADVHHMIHGLRWAPWGDLHFIQSIYINSFVDTPHGPRRMNGSGIWRFRPDTLQLDGLAYGMVNPWGYAVNQWGQGFGTDGAGGQGPHYAFPGAAFHTAVGAHRLIRGLVPGKPNNTAAEFVSGRHVPERWLGSFLGNDFRANRTVRYEMKESGSGYTAEEVETVLHSKHRSFRPVDIKMGPEGAIYVVDWYNAIIDHGEVDFHHPLRDKSHGRIWRVTAKGRPLVERPKTHGSQIPDLLNMLKAPEQYTRTQANRELASRPAQELLKHTMEWVAALDTAAPDYEHHRFEALWAMMASRVGPPALVEDILRSSDHRARAAAVRAVSNWRSQPGTIDQLKLMARAVEDEHPQVRLEAVNGLRGLGTLDAANAALRALDRENDNNLKYALELTVRHLRDVWLSALESGKPVFDGNATRLDYALREVKDSRAVGRLLEIVQRGGLEGEQLTSAANTVAALGTAEHLDALLALPTALLPAIAEGARANTAKASKAGRLVELLNGDATLAAAAAELCGRWGVSTAVEPLVKLLREKDVASAAGALARLGAIEQLKTINTPNSIAARAAAHPAEALPAAIAKFSEPIVAAYLQHAEGPKILADGLANVKLPEAIAIAATRLAHASGRDVRPLIAALNTAGDLKTVGLQLTPEDRRSLLADAAAKGDATRGREIYHRKELLCATCHMIDNKGGEVGPNLTTVGSYMTPESLLESLLNPSTDIKQGYQTVIVTTRDKAVVAGLMQRKTGEAHLIRDPAGKIVSIPNADVARLDSSPVSLMPPGLTASLRRDELVDLMKLLTSLGKVPR